MPLPPSYMDGRVFEWIIYAGFDLIQMKFASTSAMKLIHFQLPPKFIALDGVVDANVVLEADEALINSNLRRLLRHSN